MKYAYFPGCSLESTAAEYAWSAEAVCERLGIELEEVDDWVCCGATPAHVTSHLLSTALPIVTCAAAEKQQLDVVACCAACSNRLKVANHEVQEDAELLRQVNEVSEEDYQGTVKVLHLLELLANDIGVDAIREKVVRPLEGLKVACYYGCLLSRVPAALRVDSVEYPMMMDNMIEACGATPVDWPYKSECCGAALTLAKQETVFRLVSDVLSMAEDNGADVIAVACPLCQANLDMYHPEARKLRDRDFYLPVLYFTQLMGLAFDVPKDRLGFNKLIVDPLPVLAGKGLVAERVLL